MSHAHESAEDIARRMESQRAQLHRQFVKPPAPEPTEEAGPVVAAETMQPYQPRSLLMRLLMGNPQLIQRAAVLAITTLVGARYSSWVIRLGGLFLAHRARLRAAGSA